jgi:hypothetical protein
MYERRCFILGDNNSSCNCERPDTAGVMKTVLQLKERKNDYGQ